MAEEPTGLELLLQHRVTVLEERFTHSQQTLNGNLQKMWSAIDQLRNRPPAWVAVVFGLGGGAIGGLFMALVQALSK